MNFRTIVKISFALALALALVGLTPETAVALGHRLRQLDGFRRFGGLCGVPIQAVYQFPAAVAFQQGVEIPVAPEVPLYVRVGNHHVLNR